MRGNTKETPFKSVLEMMYHILEGHDMNLTRLMLDYMEKVRRAL